MRGSPAMRMLMLLAFGMFTGGALGSPRGDFERLASDKGSALVTVKFLLKVRASGMGEQELDTEITGLMIDPKGLVLCSNAQLTAMGGLMRRFARAQMSATPTNIRVLVGDDSDGMGADLVARDTELDLAWLRIKDVGDKVFNCVDIESSARPTLGQRMIAMRRMSKFFERTLVVSEGQLGGVTIKPRQLMVPTGGLSTDFGSPVFTDQGDFVGLVVLQAPDEEDAGNDAFGRMNDMRDAMNGLILPAADVARATMRAREVAPAASQPSSAPSEGSAEPGGNGE